ncbi:biotin--[acetyl-CoA-carboxylase] ligase [Halobacteriales archaeon QH_10_67_13]|nr:MAG: biotin--[acetyl-CoA-carboxylase] ligase [Halobacteriales archaeon QH_10_67_13]
MQSPPDRSRGQLLEALAAGPVGLAALADRTGLSRAAVRDGLDALERAGFEFRETETGYAVDSVPAYGAGAIEYGLSAPVAVAYHDRLPSTNARARELATRGVSDIAVVAAEQTGGRGRRDRTWASPRGGVWLSILLRPAGSAAHAPVYTLAGAVAVADAIPDEVAARIKWPNDILVGKRKLAGVLTETATTGGELDWVIVGIGVNANVDPTDLPGEDPTSLRAELGLVDRRQLAQRIIERTHELAGAPEDILPAWRRLADTLGRRVRVETDSETIVGEAVDVTFPGALVVETPASRRTVAAGECEPLRPADPR